MYNTKYRNNNKGKQPGSFRKYKSLRANAYQANLSSSNFRRLMNNDSSNSSSKSVEVPGTVPILQYQANADSNLSKWIEALQPILESLFGHLASFIATDASLNALTNYYKIKQKDKENIVQFKDRLLAAVERIRSVDETKTP